MTGWELVKLMQEEAISDGTRFVCRDTKNNHKRVYIYKEKELLAATHLTETIDMKYLCNSRYEFITLIADNVTLLLDGMPYYYIREDGMICTHEWMEDSVACVWRRSTGNVFITKEQAEKTLKTIE